MDSFEMEKRSIEEIVAIYEIEPSVRDIYVEGERDKAFFKWLIGSGVETESEVYSIDDIDIPDSDITRFNLNLGSKRSKVIAASMVFNESTKHKNNALFIIDRDYNSYIEEGIFPDALRLTDYNSIELYSMSEKAIGKIMATAYGCYSTSPPNFFFEMKTILRKIYSIRLSNLKLEWGMSWLDFKKYVKVDQSVTFQDEKYIEAYLKKNSKWSQRSKFEDMLNSCENELKTDCRLSVRGHDFTKLFLQIANKKVKSRKMDNIDAFEGFLMSALEKADLMEETSIGDIFEFSKIA